METFDALMADAAAHEAEGRPDEAVQSYQAAAQAKPDSAAAPYNAANLLRAMGAVAPSLDWYAEAIRRLPNFPQAHHNRAVALLQLGRWQEGFAEYEWRKACPGFVEETRYRLKQPWRGEDPRGKTLYIFAELYQGDLLQFARFALAAEQFGARVILAAPRAMHAILQAMSSTLRLVDADAPPPDHDYQAPLLSLPLLFGASPDRIPLATLRADPQRVARWRGRIGEHGYRIGIAWQGSARATDRSFPLAVAARALGDRDGVRLISLQKHAGLDQLDDCPTVETLGEDFDAGGDAFLDTAAAMACCDLIVSADTSTAHLAGLIGGPAWIALPHSADWRWLIGRATTPWYPAMRLFRQACPGDWAGVFMEMRAALG